MAKWITVTKAPFDYLWPGVVAITAFTSIGEYFVKDEVAEFAIGKGYARAGKKRASTARSTKGKTGRERAATRPAKEIAAGEAADVGAAARLGDADAVDADRAADRPGMDHDAG